MIQHYLKYTFGTFLSLISLVFLYLLFKLIIIPLKKLHFYKNQGLPMYFYPFLGTRKRQRNYELKYNDNLAYSRNLSKENPNLRAEITHFGERPMLILYDPKLIKEFYIKPMSYYEKVQPKILVKIFGQGILFAGGTRWKHHRKVISNVFHFEFLKENIPLVVGTAREFIGELKGASLKSVDALDEIQKITGEVIGRTFFGEKLNKYIIKGLPMTLYMADLLARSSFVGKGRLFSLFFFAGWNLELIPSHHEYMNEVREFRRFCLKIIQNQKGRAKQGVDMLSLLLDTQKASKEEERFTDDDLLDEFITFFIAGMDTTANLSNMALYMMYEHPEVMEKFKREVKEIYSKNDVVTIEELNQMEYTHAILKETLRLYTPAPSIIPRTALVDHEILDLKIKKGTSVQPGFTFNSSNGKYFEQPERFWPERWLNKKNDVDTFAFTPFSAGPRNCIGQHLAMMEAKIILAEFVKAFEYKVVPEDYKLVMTQSFLYRPKEKIRFDLTVNI